MTVEIVKKRLTMDAMSYRMQRLELKHKSNMSVEPFPSRTTELLDELRKLNEELTQVNDKRNEELTQVNDKRNEELTQVNDKRESEKPEKPEATDDLPYILFKLSNARACLTWVLFTAAILASIATYVEFVRYNEFVWWSYWVGVFPVFIFSIPFVIVRFEIKRRLMEKIKRTNR